MSKKLNTEIQTRKGVKSLRGTKRNLAGLRFPMVILKDERRVYITDIHTKQSEPGLLPLSETLTL